MKSRFPVAALFFIVLIAFLAFSSNLHSFSLEGRVKEFTLQNGIKVLMLERHQSPIISLLIQFRVGATDENLGMTGTAHLLEHMLFKGTKTLGTINYAEEEKILKRIDSLVMAIEAEKVKGEKADKALLADLGKTLQELQDEHKKWVVKDEIDLLYSQNGGVGFNAMTGADTTTYVIQLPANSLELWARIESDRILNPVLREFYTERDVIMEERRQSIDSQPERKLVEQFLAAAFIAHPYGRPVIGWPSDVQHLDKNATEKFFQTYYSPANTVLAIVGDIKTEEALALVKKYFERIPPQPLPPPLRTEEPGQLGERRIQVIAEANPQLIIGFHKLNPPHADDVVFEVIDGLLSFGRTSRFYKHLVEGEKIAASVYSSNSFPGDRYPNLFVVFASPRNPHTAQELEKSIERELDRLKSEPVSNHELQKVKNQIQAGFLHQLISNQALAYHLAHGQSIFGDWRYFTERLKSLEKVTAEDISRVAKKYFTSRNRTVATLVPATEFKEN